MSGHSTYQPQSPFMQWMERRLPIVSLVYSSFVAYPTPRNLNYWWTFGGILTFMLGVQIVTGIVLAMHYTPHVDYAFISVESIMRDVNYGWLLRYLHANGASFFFVAVYAHIARGMYYGSYKEPREVLVDPRRHSFPVDGGDRLHGLRAALGPDEFLGRHRHHQPVLGAARRRRADRHLAVGRLRRRQSDAQSLLFAALPVAVRHRRRGGAARLGAAYGRAEQSDRRRAEDREGHRCVHALCDRQGRLLHRRVLPVLRLVRVLPAELSRPLRQLHHGQSGPDAHPYRAGMVLPAVLRHPARHPEQAPRRHRAGKLDHHSRLPALARYLARAFGELPAAVPAIPADLLRRRDRAWLSRLPRAVGRLCDRGAHPHRLLFRFLPRHPAAARIVREDQAAAEFDFGSGVAGAPSGARA